MVDPVLHAEDGDLLHRLNGLLDQLAGSDLTGRSDTELLALWQGLETARNRFPTLDQRIIAEARHRHLESVFGAGSLTVLARDVLHLSVSTARARVKAAEALGPRRALTGEPLAPLFARLAAAQATGSVCEAAAAVILAAVDKLPARVQDQHGTRVEAFLTEQAQVLDVDGLRIVARTLHDTLDPDGTLHDEHDRARNRALDILHRADGSGAIRGELTAELTELLLTVFDAHAKPRTGTDGGKDPRTATQRRHDALRDGLKTLLRSGQVPMSGGITTTVLLMLGEQALATGEGTAITGHGGRISAQSARSWLGSDTRILPIKLTRTKAITEYGSTHRLFTQTQRLAMAARDLGCTFPGCTVPASWCDAHHVTDYANGGPTTVDNGTLLCGYHHNHFDKLGWRCHMSDGLPHWTPPRWLDPHQRPRRNHAHNPQLE